MNIRFDNCKQSKKYAHAQTQLGLCTKRIKVLYEYVEIKQTRTTSPVNLKLIKLDRLDVRR